MKCFEKINIKLLLAFLIFFAITFINNKSTAMLHYQTVATPTGIVTATTLNIRQGPGTTYKSITTVRKNEYIRIDNLLLFSSVR